MPEEQRQEEQHRSRSVNDFDTQDGLRKALNQGEAQVAFIDIGRDFPRALLGSTLGLPRDDDSQSECSTVFEPDTDLDWMLSNFDEETSRMQTLDEELNRLQVLKSYLILDSEREANFERLTGLAARIFQVPIALVSLVDLGRQWFMSNKGLGDVRETPRKSAFCAHAVISKEDLLIVPDATKDPRFSENPLVTGPPHIRFYAGAPLLCPEGYRLGTLCVIGPTVRPEGLNLEERQTIRELAALVVDAMVERRREKLSILQDKSQIIATTAHDLLTPLSGVQMSMSLLLDDDDLKPHLSSSHKDIIETASTCADVMNRICQDAIETFRGDMTNRRTAVNGKDSNGMKTIVVAELVKNVNMVMEPFPKKVPLFISVDPLVPREFSVADDLKVFRSIINYLTNALKKTEKGNVHLKLYVGGKKKKPKLVFECEDTGPGIAVDNLQYLFRPFRESTRESECIRVGADGQVAAGVCRANMSNLGLGLYSVANQVSSIGGEYGFRPRETTSPPRPDGSKATGSIFWFSIPLVVPRLNDADNDGGFQGDSVPASVNSDSSQHKVVRVLSTKNLDAKDSDMIYGVVNKVLAEEHQRQQRTSFNDGKRTRRALVIDDSIVIRKSVGRALSRLGYEVEQAVNGLEGLRMLQQHVYDIVLCDYLMPVMDGLDCVQQYRDWEEAHRPWFRQYIVGISAHASSGDVEKGMKAGMNDFRGKPVTMKHLQELEKSEPLVEVSKVLDTVMTLEGAGPDLEIASTEMGSVDSADSTQHLANVSSAQRGAEDGPVCLIAEPASNIVMKDAVERLGWRAVHVHDGEDALRLMKMRNWDAVFVENEISRLTGTGCVARFREWESENRVARQNNVFLLSTDFVPSPVESVSAVYPSGFDGALGKPILVKDLTFLLQRAENSIVDSAKSSSIVAR